MKKVKTKLNKKTMSLIYLLKKTKNHCKIIIQVKLIPTKSCKRKGIQPTRGVP